MTTTRGPKPSRSRILGVAASLVLTAAIACTPATAPAHVDAPVGEVSVRTSDDPADAPAIPRRPDAVVVEPPPALPASSARAEARGVVALREPSWNDPVAELVEALADAWSHQSLDALLALLAPDAGPFDARAKGRPPIIEAWRQRLQAHNYARLAGVELVRPERIERWTWEELGGAGTPARPDGMRPGEVLVHAPVEVTRVSGERLFGDVLLLVVRREGEALRIAAYGEENAP